MANDLFGGLGNLGGALGGLMGGLANSGLVPQDSPEAKFFKTQSEVADLQKQEAEILADIGRKAFEQNPSAWPQADKLRLIRSNLAEAQAALEQAKKVQADAKAAQEAADAKGRCSGCGYKNPEGVKFCQECGTPLGTGGAKPCVSCGAELTPGTRFCGECGARQGE